VTRSVIPRPAGEGSLTARRATADPSLAARDDYGFSTGLLDQQVRVFLKEESSRNRLRRGSAHCNDIAGVVGVAFFQRQARVARRLALGLGLGEGDHAARVVADLAMVEGTRTARGDVPA
jgi:hypothetical protein